MIVSKSLADHHVGAGHLGSSVVSRCGKRKSRRSEPVTPDGFVLLQEEEPLKIPEPENKKLTEYRDAPASPPPSDAVNELSPFDDEPSSPPPFLHQNNERLPNELLDEICSDMGIKDSMDLDFVEFLMDQQVPQFSAHPMGAKINRMYKTRDGTGMLQMPPGTTTLPQQIAVTSSQTTGYSASSSSSGSPVSKRFHLAPPSSGTSPNKEQVQSVSSTSVLNTPIKLSAPPTPLRTVSSSTPLPLSHEQHDFISNCSTDQQKINRLMMQQQQQQRMENNAKANNENNSKGSMENNAKMRCHTPSNMNMGIKSEDCVSLADSGQGPTMNYMTQNQKILPRTQQHMQQSQYQQYNAYQQQQQQQQQSMPPPVVNVGNMQQRPNMSQMMRQQQCNNRPPNNMLRMQPHPIQSYQKAPFNTRTPVPRYMNTQGPCSPLDRGYYSSETNSVRSFTSSSSSTGNTVLQNPATTSNTAQSLSSNYPGSQGMNSIQTMSNAGQMMHNVASSPHDMSQRGQMTPNSGQQMSNLGQPMPNSGQMPNAMQNSRPGQAGHPLPSPGGSGYHPGQPMSTPGVPNRPGQVMPNNEQGLLSVAPPHQQSHVPSEQPGGMYPHHSQGPHHPTAYNYPKNNQIQVPTSCMKANNYPEISPHSYLLRNFQQTPQQPQNCGPYNPSPNNQTRLPQNSSQVPYETVTDFNANEHKPNINKIHPKMNPYIKPDPYTKPDPYNMGNVPPGMMMQPSQFDVYNQNNPDVIPNSSPLTYTDLDMPNMSPYPHPHDYNRGPHSYPMSQPQPSYPYKDIESAASDFTVMTDGPMTVPGYDDGAHLGPPMLHGAYGSSIPQPSPRIATQGPYTPCDPSMMSSREYGGGIPGETANHWGSNSEGTPLPGAYGKPPDLLCQQMPGMSGPPSSSDEFISPLPHVCSGIDCLECKASLSMRPQASMSSQQRFIQNLITDRSNAFRSHPLYPLLRDLIIADMNFNSPHFPYQLISNLPKDFDKLLHNFLHRNPPTGNYQGNYAVESVVMDALRYAHSCLIEKIKTRRDEDETTKNNTSSKSLSAIEEFCEKFDRAVRNMSGPEPNGMVQGPMPPLVNGMMHDTGVMLPSNSINAQMPPPSMYGMSPMKKPMDIHPAMLGMGPMHQAYQDGYLSNDSSSYSNHSNKSESKKHPSLPKEAVAIMLDWLRSHKDNPYPNDDELYDAKSENFTPYAAKYAAISVPAI